MSMDHITMDGNKLFPAVMSVRKNIFREKETVLFFLSSVESKPPALEDIARNFDIKKMYTTKKFVGCCMLSFFFVFRVVIEVKERGIENDQKVDVKRSQAIICLMCWNNSGTQTNRHEKILMKIKNSSK
jgi:hypothetical protein